MKTFTILFLFCSALLSAQNSRVYKGKIGTLNISLYLEGLESGTHADQIFGVYKYEKESSHLLLSGYLNQSGNIVLIELSNSNFSGVFRGKVVNKGFSGIWTNDSGSKSLPFTLMQAKTSDAENQKFKEAIRDKQSEFANY